MSGTVAGGLKAAASNKARHGADFYQSIGAKGGSKGKADGVIKGFALMPLEKVIAAGKKGGRLGRRKKEGAAWNMKAN